MKSAADVFFTVILFATTSYCVDAPWYVGDQRCPPPKDDGAYSAPYNALEHQQEYPTFPEADKPGWSCSYQKEDGVLVQYGDSRTPQQQWLAVWDRHNSE